MSLNSDYSLSDIAAASGGNRNGGGLGFGGDGILALLVLFFFMMMFGGGLWGGGAWGGGGGQTGYDTRADVQRGFDNSAVITKLDGITQGVCDSTYALNNAITNGFHGVDSAVCNLGYQVQQGFNGTQMAIMQGNNALQAQLADCCCQTQRAIDGVNYNMATQACETRHAIQDGTRQILDFLAQDKISTLQAENTALKFQASQTAQNGFIDAVGNSIVAQLRQPTPIPAFAVPNPYACYGYGFNSNPCCNPCG